MRFNIAIAPERMRADVEIGNVYKANGGRGTTAFWLVIAVNGQMAHALGLNREGLCVSTTSYGIHAFACREPVGFCPEVADLLFTIEERGL